MGTRSASTCDDCYFRQEGLCALPGNRVCPTFRESRTGSLVPPPQPRLVLIAPSPGGVGIAQPVGVGA